MAGTSSYLYVVVTGVTPPLISSPASYPSIETLLRWSTGFLRLLLELGDMVRNLVGVVAELFIVEPASPSAINPGPEIMLNSGGEGCGGERWP